MQFINPQLLVTGLFDTKHSFSYFPAKLLHVFIIFNIIIKPFFV